MDIPFNNERAVHEKCAVQIFNDADLACGHVADTIHALIKERNAAGEKTVLGLATGSTPVRLYRELIRRHQEEGLSFKNVITYNLDEYFGLDGDHPESYRRFMQDQLFDHVDILPENTHVPSGTVEREEAFASCQAYEDLIRESGGIDIQILGIGRTGHIGFNEPGSGPESRTRLVTLDSLTLRDAARDFLGKENVPRHAITMGVGTILDARQVFLLAWGEAKSGVIAKAVENQPTDAIPASFLQQHEDCLYCIDEGAASRLTRVRLPWLVGSVRWTAPMIRQAMVWLARRTGKALLKLTDEDYAENGMGELLTEKGPAHKLNIDIFNVTQHTITGWPGGKPNADDSCRPERADPSPKRSLLIAPEPTDDTLSMGGTLQRLVAQGHHVYLNYLTSGNLAVPDPDTRLALDLIIELGQGLEQNEESRHAKKVSDQLEAKGRFGEDTADIRHLKGLIRRGEVRSSARLFGVEADRITFLDLPFYENGRYRRFKTIDADVDKVTAQLQAIQPHQIFTTGMVSDPLSVASIGFQVLLQALARCHGEPWLEDCYIWLFAGSGGEWDTHEIDMAVPLSPNELSEKLQAIYQHQTQRSQSPSLNNNGAKNHWDTAAIINQQTARVYDALGLAEYEAIEGFKRFSL